jgi:phosphoribosyl 1,2-cyclic phosphodiesterase
VRFASLGSGSEGNALVVEAGGTCLMVDCGFSTREALRRLSRLGLSPGDVGALLVTHEHDDHSGGAFPLARACGAPVWLTRGTLAALREADPRVDEGVEVRLLHGGLEQAIGALEVRPFTVPHDAREPVQYVFSDGDARLGVLTDLGHPTAHVASMLSGCDALVLECNHDAGMLAAGSYPAWLKRRIGGNHGHLSNAQAAELLSVLDRSRLRHLVAAHLSRSNNHPELALAALESVIGGRPDWLGIAQQAGGFDWRET